MGINQTLSTKKRAIVMPCGSDSAVGCGFQATVVLELLKMDD
jgi:hypothetical protein